LFPGEEEEKQYSCESRRGILDVRGNALRAGEATKGSTVFSRHFLGKESRERTGSGKEEGKKHGAAGRIEKKQQREDGGKETKKKPRLRETGLRAKKTQR